MSTKSSEMKEFEKEYEKEKLANRTVVVLSEMVN